jgi:hypothetical protein
LLQFVASAAEEIEELKARLLEGGPFCVSSDTDPYLIFGWIAVTGRPAAGFQN